MGYTKNRLVEMMEKVSGTKLTLNEATQKGTSVEIKNVSPETIDIGDNIASPDVGDASTKMTTPRHIIWWKRNFIDKFGDEGHVVKGLELPNTWDVVGNEKYDEWKNNYMTAKGNFLNRERQAGRSID